MSQILGPALDAERAAECAKHDAEQRSNTQRCVSVRERWYTVSFGQMGEPTCVQVHVMRDGCCTALRRISLKSIVASIAIARAKGPASISALSAAKA